MHTNRTLQTLRREGLIQLNARSLVVLDWPKLKEAGDFDEIYLHHQGAKVVEPAAVAAKG